MIYLSSPYSHPLPSVREERFHAACRATAALLSQGKRVFSPIVHSHPLDALLQGFGHQFWMDLDEQYLKLCKEVLVLTIDGWAESRGVMQEMQWAQELGMPICYAGPEHEMFRIKRPTCAGAPT